MHRFRFILFIIPIVVLHSGCDIEEVYIPPEPTVRIVTPASASVILDSVLIVIEAEDDRGIARVDLFIDDKMPPGGKLLYEPYEYMWKTEQYADSTPHIIYARAYDTDSNSTTSNKISIVTNRFAPSGLLATVVNDTVLRFTWTDHSSLETGFQLFESINDSGFFLRKTVPANTTTTDIEGLFAGGVRYVYMLRAIKDSIKSKFSNSQTVFVVLSPPMVLNIHTLTDTLIELRWQQGANAFEEYVEIEQRIGTGPFAKIGTVPAGSRSFTVARYFKSGTNYSYRARAFSKYNVSGYSNVVTENFLFPAPTSIVAEHMDKNSATISWNDNSSFEKGFAIERLTYGSGTFSEVHRTGPNATSWTDTSLDTAQSYQWRVRAYTDSNLTSYTAAVFASWFPAYEKKFDLTVSGSAVTGVQYVPLSSSFISSHADDAVVVWNAGTGAVIRTIKPLTNGVYALAVSPDGNFVAGGGGDGTVKIWNINTGTLQQTISAHSGQVLDLHFNSAGTMLASAGADAVVRVWNIGGGSLQTNFTGHTDSTTAVRFSPNGASVASAGKDMTVRLWDAAAGTQQWSRSFTSVRINDLAFASNGNSIAVGQSMTFGNPIVVLNAMNGDTSNFFNRLGSSSNAIEYSPTGITIVSSGDDGQIATFHLTRPFIYTNVPASQASIRALSHSSNASMLVTGSSNGTISVWNVENRWQKFTP